jgi:hypothetical protein
MSDIVNYGDIMEGTNRYTQRISIDKDLLLTEVVKVKEPDVMDVKL